MVDISQKREPKTQKMTKSYLCINFGFIFLQKTYLGLFLSSHSSESPISLLPTELVQTLTVTLTHRMQKAFPKVDYD